MALFRNMLEPMALDESLNPANYQQTLLPQPESRGGLLGALSNPRVRAMLAGMSQSLAQAAGPSLTPKGTGFGAALSAGIQGANTGIQSYEESLAKQAADAFNKRIEEARMRKDLADAAKAEAEAANVGEESPYDVSSIKVDDLGEAYGWNKKTGRYERLPQNAVPTNFKQVTTYNPATGAMEITLVDPRSAVKGAAGGGVVPVGEVAPTEGQTASAGFAERMQAADEMASKIESTGYDPSNVMDQTALSVPFVGNYMVSDQGQSYRAAQEEWVRAKLRKESGAAIPQDEMDREIATYFPKPGDSAEVIQQKAAARKRATSGQVRQAGPALRKPEVKVLRWNPSTGRVE